MPQQAAGAYTSGLLTRYQTTLLTGRQSHSKAYSIQYRDGQSLRLAFTFSIVNWTHLSYENIVLQRKDNVMTNNHILSEYSRSSLSFLQLCARQGNRKKRKKNMWIFPGNKIIVSNNVPLIGSWKYIFLKTAWIKWSCYKSYYVKKTLTLGKRI